MGRPAILALGLLALSVVFAVRWLSRSGALDAAGVGPTSDAPPAALVDAHGQDSTPELVEPDRSAAPMLDVETRAAPHATGPVPEAGTIRGRVVSDKGDSIEGAQVHAVLQTDAEEDPPTLQAVSDRAGHFTLEGCSNPGEYELRAELDTWWLSSTIVCTTGTTDAELVLQRGGGVRGQVIEALGSRIEDYIVVVRHEPPPVEWTPETRARLDRSLERELRQMTRNAMVTRMLMQDLGHQSQPEQRPDGEAWTLLQPDGRFELGNLRPGKSSVIVAARNRTRGLATIAGVEIRSDVLTQDPRVNPVNLNESACVYSAVVTDPDGALIARGSLEVLPVEKDGHGKFTIDLEDGSASFVGPLWIDRITISAEGYRAVFLRSPTQTLRVTLSR
jgi:hypothetical protein